MSVDTSTSAPVVDTQEEPAPAWTDPPWTGWIETTGDALLILEAARRGMIPRVTRRLVDSERRMITSGSVFVFDEDESGIKRWTDGFFWSPSRILGNFLVRRRQCTFPTGGLTIRCSCTVKQIRRQTFVEVSGHKHQLVRPPPSSLTTLLSPLGSAMTRLHYRGPRTSILVTLTGLVRDHFLAVLQTARSLNLKG